MWKPILPTNDSKNEECTDLPKKGNKYDTGYSIYYTCHPLNEELTGCEGIIKKVEREMGIIDKVHLGPFMGEDCGY